MKYFTVLFTALLIFSSCQSDTYYAAKQANHKRFDGWNREDATFLVDAHDQALLINSLSEVAEANANLRKTFIFTKDIQEELEGLFTKFKLEATVKRIKLASSLSEEGDEYVQKLSSISSENFDKVYFQYLNTAINKITQQSESYIDEGHSDRLIELAREIKKEIEPFSERVEKEDLS